MRGEGAVTLVWSRSGNNERNACKEVMVDMHMAMISAICQGVVGMGKGKRSRPDPLAARMPIRER